MIQIYIFPQTWLVGFKMQVVIVDWLQAKHIFISGKITSFWHFIKAPNIFTCSSVPCNVQLIEDTSTMTITKHIMLKIFFTHDLRKTSNFQSHKIHSSHNTEELFAKRLLTLSDVIIRGKYTCCNLFSFPDKVFNERTSPHVKR